MGNMDCNGSEESRRQKEIHVWRGLFEVASLVVEKYVDPGPLTSFEIGPWGPDEIRAFLIFKTQEDADRAAMSGRTDAIKEDLIEQLKRQGRDKDRVAIHVEIQPAQPDETA